MAILFPFQNPDLPVDDRVRDLVTRMTVEEKISQLVYEAKAIPHLGIEEYNWWNECLHGVGRAGVATVFPQAIGLAATFDPDLVHRAAVAISDEARAKHHEAARRGYRRQYRGLTCWTPNVNIFRDPRWGRGQETYGEDPYLTGRMGVAFVTGLQGDDPRYLKLVATPKHYAVHSGPEALRHHFDVRVSAKDLRETYLPAFRDCVIEGKAHSVMGAYNRVDGEPACAHTVLLQGILRDEWGFGGYVVSDCGAIDDFHAHHTVTGSPAQSAALAVRKGCDLECGRVYPALSEALAEGLVSEADIDRSVSRLMRARFLLGMFDPDDRVPYARIPYETVDSPEHQALALEAARASLILLKNTGSLLPLRRDLGCVAVIGPNADDREVLVGNYAGVPSRPVTVLEGIRQAVSPSTRVLYAPGCDIVRGEDYAWGERGDDGFAEALAAADRADVVMLVLGLSNRLEGEEGGASLAQWMGDRIRMDLPKIQRRLFEAVSALGKPLVLVLLTGSPLAIPGEHERAGAVLLAWYPGQSGGIAVADVLFGRVSPSGRLPVTFVRSVEQLPSFTEYAMTGRTYRFMESAPLYPFGYGLSYSSFSYAGLKLSAAQLAPGDELELSVEVRNTGRIGASEVVQVYLSDLEASVRVPRWQLAGFTRVFLEPGVARNIRFTINARQMAAVDERGRHVVEPGRFRVHVGGRQPD
ncbi:MAG: glycoside hydrolase family 3 C-terminal domain-containing protein, partial [Spirochaetes bacterium]|nr:glycoside hydrolase family 3 C-terminal domain-containing protein [Spirochaetota bacterium]